MVFPSPLLISVVPLVSKLKHRWHMIGLEEEGLYSESEEETDEAEDEAETSNIT